MDHEYIYNYFGKRSQTLRVTLSGVLQRVVSKAQPGAPAVTDQGHRDGGRVFHNTLRATRTTMLAASTSNSSFFRQGRFQVGRVFWAFYLFERVAGCLFSVLTTTTPARASSLPYRIASGTGALVVAVPIYLLHCQWQFDLVHRSSDYFFQKLYRGRLPASSFHSPSPALKCQPGVAGNNDRSFTGPLRCG